MIYFNEIEPFCIDWLRNQFGDVDERDIRNITVPAGALRQHYFAGLGGWEYALQLAGWPEDQPVWTGSCPCQPFSVAGHRQAHEDERDLWPAFFRLIAIARPAVILGEQVNGAIAYGWLDRICDDLEGIGYAVGASVLPACGVGAPHIRQRLYWVAYPSAGGAPQYAGAFEPTRREPRPCSDSDGLDDSGRQPDERFGDGGELRSPPATQQGEAPQRERDGHASGDASANGGLALSDHERQREFRFESATNGDASSRHDLDRSLETDGLADTPDARHPRAGEHGGGPSSLPARPVEHGNDGGMAQSESQLNGSGYPRTRRRVESANGGETVGVADTAQRGQRIYGSASRQSGYAELGIEAGGLGDSDRSRREGRSLGPQQRADQLSAWAASDVIYCRDGRSRRVPLEPSFLPLADSGRFGNPRVNPDLSSRIGALRASGNAIVIPLAAEFVKAVMEIYFGRPVT